MKKLVLIIVLNLFLALNSFSQEKQSDSTICYPSAIMHSQPVNNNRFHPPVYQDYKKFIDTTKVIKPHIHPSPPSFPCQTPPDKAEQGYNPKKPIQNLPCMLTNIRGLNFEGNNLAGGYPGDDYLAISNNGSIISVNNYTVRYFDINNGQVIDHGFTLLKDFFPYNISNTDKLFDPKIIYDRYENRFIFILLYHNYDYSVSKIFIAFSDNITNSSSNIGWYHYYFEASDFFNNTNNTKYWFDYPNIALNKDELFISLNIWKSPSGQYHKPIIFEIDKNDVYTNYPNNLIFRTYTELFAGNRYAINILPVNESLQSDNYENVMYFVDNRSYGSNDMWWKKLTGNIYNNPSITNHYFHSPIHYNIASYASQLGGNPEDRIRIIDNCIQSGYFRDGKIHFVIHSSDQGWMQIVYYILNTNNSTANVHTLSGKNKHINYLYPSIAYIGSENNQEDKSIFTFNRTGPNMYIDIAAVDYINRWGCINQIKKGEGILNLADYTNSGYKERIGDYTQIQRKYNSGNAWLIASYPFGSQQNNFGVTNGLNNWISEIFLFNPIVLELDIDPFSFKIFPNPNNTNILNISFTNDKKVQKGKILIKDIYGNLVYSSNFNDNNIQIKLPNLKNGIYFVSIKAKSKSYETQKLIINN